MISVILPAYNAEATVREAVESVLRQSRSDFELIVINDGSTDNTLAVLSSIADVRLTVYSTAQSGPAASRNRGIERASGDYVAFIDADDVWMPGKLEAQVAALEESSHAVVAYCWTDYVDSVGRFVCPDSRPTHQGDVFETLLVHNFIDSGSNILVRRQALLDVGCFDETLPVVEDWDLYLRLAARGIFALVPVVYVHYRLSSTSLTTKVRAMEACYKRVMDRAFATAPEHLQHLRRRSAALFYQYLTGKATQGCPTRENGLTALRFFSASVGLCPTDVWQLPARLWVLKAFAKAILAIVLPAAVMRRLGYLETRVIEARRSVT